MADSKDLQEMLQFAKLRISVLEEQIILNALTDVDKRVKEFMLRKNGEKGTREPYEFS